MEHFRQLLNISCAKISMKIAILRVILLYFVRHDLVRHGNSTKGAARVQYHHAKIMVHKMPHKCNSCTIFVRFFLNHHILVNYLRCVIANKAHCVQYMTKHEPNRNNKRYGPSPCRQANSENAIFGEVLVSPNGLKASMAFPVKS